MQMYRRIRPYSSALSTFIGHGNVGATLAVAQ
jgi:hypothetical protein